MLLHLFQPRAAYFCPPRCMPNNPPNFCMCSGQLKPEGVGLAKQLLQEMMALFPNSVISSGADEVNFNCWNNATIVPQDSPQYDAFFQESVRKLAAFQEQVWAAAGASCVAACVWVHHI